MTYALIIIAYIAMAAFMYRDWLKVKKVYKVKHNGSRWVVRDSKGRFVIITRNPFDIISLGCDL
ncbi:hypotheticla protein [Erwinia phage vB_EamP-S2]|uniref:Hypotheticla protein n=1 Tax=Erwinia phage vB_EamP-S2 TaxID=2070198 RepID=A0A2K9V4W7_9CAUD|nr:hypotheticla protein [Erwinia phage vB_EamP-S2]AUV57200.1 hypotheticla protein [Erwinia phage vB_EamP-S2]UNA00887.1 hypothetical protein VLVyarbaL_00049 [Erwinia phage VyarbaL]